MKDIEGKYDPTYLFRSAKIAVHHVREYGSKKYVNRDTWVKTDKKEYIKAAERHLDSINDGEEFAKDSGLPHLWHALCDIMFAIESEKIKMKKEEDLSNIADFSLTKKAELIKKQREVKRSLYAID